MAIGTRARERHACTADDGSGPSNRTRNAQRQEVLFRGISLQGSSSLGFDDFIIANINCIKPNGASKLWFSFGSPPFWCGIKTWFF